MIRGQKYDTGTRGYTWRGPRDNREHLGTRGDTWGHVGTRGNMICNIETNLQMFHHAGTLDLHLGTPGDWRPVRDCQDTCVHVDTWEN